MATSGGDYVTLGLIYQWYDIWKCHGSMIIEWDMNLRYIRHKYFTCLGLSRANWHISRLLLEVSNWPGHVRYPQTWQDGKLRIPKLTGAITNCSMRGFPWIFQAPLMTREGNSRILEDCLKTCLYLRTFVLNMASKLWLSDLREGQKTSQQDSHGSKMGIFSNRGSHHPKISAISVLKILKPLVSDHFAWHILTNIVVSCQQNFPHDILHSGWFITQKCWFQTRNQAPKRHLIWQQPFRHFGPIQGRHVPIASGDAAGMLALRGPIFNGSV